MTKAEAPIPSLKPIALTAALALFVIFGEPLLRIFPQGEQWWLPSRNGALAAMLFLGAHLVHAGSAARLTRRKKGVRPVPRVALDLLRLALFAAATLASLSLFFRDDLSGILTGSGLVLAVLGFAIRNVVADTFSGLALGLEAPFRIGDWVSIDGLTQGRVQEIGWRSTRLITRDSTHVILPNSQISRQKITNFSAPRQEYRDHVELTLPITLPVAEARSLISTALLRAESILQGKKPEVQVSRFGPQGISFRVKYWVPRHDLEMTCRDEVFSCIDARLREEGVALMAIPATTMEALVA